MHFKKKHQQVYHSEILHISNIRPSNSISTFSFIIYIFICHFPPRNFKVKFHQLPLVLLSLQSSLWKRFLPCIPPTSHHLPCSIHHTDAGVPGSKWFPCHKVGASSYSCSCSLKNVHSFLYWSHSHLVPAAWHQHGRGHSRATRTQTHRGTWVDRC